MFHTLLSSPLQILNEEDRLIQGLAWSYSFMPLDSMWKNGRQLMESYFDAIQKGLPLCYNHIEQEILGEVLSWEKGSAMVTMESGEKVIHYGYLIVGKVFTDETIKKIKDKVYTALSVNLTGGKGLREISLTDKPAYGHAVLSEEQFAHVITRLSIEECEKKVKQAGVI